MPKSTDRRFLALGGAVAATIGYIRLVRPWHLRWGATPQEVTAIRPGDQLVGRPRYQTDRCVTIDAAIDGVWPWLVQIGVGRGGFYSYDFLENLTGLAVHTADRIYPELQNLVVGQVLPNKPATPDEGVHVAVLEPPSALVLHGTVVPGRKMTPDLKVDRSEARWADFTWGFFLDRVDERRTRLHIRLRADYRGLAYAAIFRLGLEPVQFLMERKMLRGIQVRAEGRAPSSP